LKPARRGQVSADDVIAWARTKMAAYKVPNIVAFEESLPKSATGKILWRALQERESGAHAETR
jgi:acyl-CoA synthetase (AMP-forming)/AMP-acid ligase II